MRGGGLINNRHLHYFLIVAKHLNFSRAAEELYISQPALSKQISDLEKDMGVPLFIRGKRALHLTPSGKVLFQEGEAYLVRLTELYQKVKSASTADCWSLRIGFMGSIAALRLPLLTKIFNQIHNVDLHINRYSWNSLITALKQNEVDVGFVLSMGHEKEDELEREILCSNSLAIVTNEEHWLANESFVRLTDLATEKFVLPSRSESPTCYRHTMRLCLNAGFTPNIISEPPLLETVLMLVQAGFGISLLSRLALTTDFPNLRFIDFEDTLPINLVLAWNKKSHNPAIPLFCEMAKDIVWL